MSKPLLVDLFCGAGGATAGYMEAGFEVLGVDIKPQPNYCGDLFIRADALEWWDSERDCYDFVAVHASPPCQTFTRAKHLREAQGGESSAVDLVDPTRRRLRFEGVPYVIENVPGAPLYGVTLCGSSFGLKVRRHRVFESNVWIPQPPCDHKAQGRPVGVYHVLNDHIPKGGTTAATLEEGQAAMGIDWMVWNELKEAIPPAYTEYIGGVLMAELADSRVRAAA